jgi:hypothetical protein
VVAWNPPNGIEEQFTTKTIFPHNFILGITFQGDDIWVATEDGLGWGTLSPVTVGAVEADDPEVNTNKKNNNNSIPQGN